MSAICDSQAHGIQPFVKKSSLELERFWSLQQFVNTVINTVLLTGSRGQVFPFNRHQQEGTWSPCRNDTPAVQTINMEPFSLAVYGNISYELPTIAGQGAKSTQGGNTIPPGQTLVENADHRRLKEKWNSACSLSKQGQLEHVFRLRKHLKGLLYIHFLAQSIKVNKKLRVPFKREDI